MKFVPLIKLDNRKTAMTLCWQIVTSLVFFRLLANLEQSENRIPDEWSVKLTFSSTVTFFPFFFFDVEAIKTVKTIYNQACYLERIKDLPKFIIYL